MVVEGFFLTERWFP